MAKFRLLECLGFPEEDMRWITLNEQESHIHVVPMWTLASFKRLKHLSSQYAVSDQRLWYIFFINSCVCECVGRGHVMLYNDRVNLYRAWKVLSEFIRCTKRKVAWMSASMCSVWLGDCDFQVTWFCTSIPSYLLSIDEHIGRTNMGYCARAPICVCMSLKFIDMLDFDINFPFSIIFLWVTNYSRKFVDTSFISKHFWSCLSSLISLASCCLCYWASMAISWPVPLAFVWSFEFIHSYESGSIHSHSCFLPHWLDIW
jgi:hypothetical protein